ncbi:MAG TPA: hypothetical protein VFM68_03220 [Candidatus Saccharimonadales bacterium]|nr:hypothetical protein [Candidatus Saccharimonadales bacterium]
MKQYSEEELDQKIQAFMSRKTQQYPELMDTTKESRKKVRIHFSSTRFFPVIKTLKPHLFS